MQVRMFNPTTIAQEANLACSLEASKPTKPNRFTKPYNTYSKFQPSSSNPPTDNPPKPLLNKPQRTYSAIEMADKKARGLCMFCEEPFTPGHQLKHKRNQLIVLELENEDDNNIETPTDPLTDPPTYTEPHISNPNQPQLSLQALTGISNVHTIRVTGMHDRKMLQVLLDSGRAPTISWILR